MPLLVWYIRLVLLAGLFLPYKSFASIIEFDLTQVSDASTHSTLVIDQSGLELSIWGQQVNGGDMFPATVYRDEYGVGLLSSDSDNSEIDKLGPDESLFLRFNQVVSLLLLFQLLTL